jgi:hypothetical protein
MSDLSDFVGGGGLILRRQLFTASGTWTKPSGIIGEQVWVTMIGGGSSGNSNSIDVSGTSGQYITRLPIDVSGTASETITIGAGGAAATNAAGNAGAVSSFGSLVSVDGGIGPDNSGLVYLNALTGQNPGSEDNSPGLVTTIAGMFGAPVNWSVSGTIGGSGLLLDTSGKKAADQTTVGGGTGVGGIGYGAGGAASENNTIASTAGADGAILVEWMEKV